MAGTWTWRVMTGLLLLFISVLHLVYLLEPAGGTGFGASHPLSLSTDEAQYWDWSRHPDWSYYSKGPVVAFLIRASCAVFGEWSTRMVGSELVAVRLPAIFCGGLMLLSVYVLTALVFGDERLAFLTVLVGAAQPSVAIGSTLMTIDAPFTCLWGWSLVTGYYALVRHRPWAWPVTGLLVGVGILAKYTMVIWIPSAALFLIASTDRRSWWSAERHPLARLPFWVMTGVATACCLPIVIWNAGHGWVTVLHTLGHAGVTNHGGFRPLGPLEYVAVQAGVLMGYWFVAWVGALVWHRPGAERRPEVSYLWWMSVPMFLVFLGFSTRTSIQPNWPIAAYLSGLVLAAGWLKHQIAGGSAGYRRLTVGCCVGFTVLGIGLTAVLHYSSATWPLFVRWLPAPSHREPFPIRRVDPSCRLRGWDHLAAEVDAIREEVRRTEGDDPVLAGGSWILPGVLGFYLPDHPQAYSVGTALGERHSQYDFWRPNPLSDPDVFRGRTFVIVGSGPSEPIRAAFARTEPARLVTYEEQGQPVSRWVVTIGHGFRGFPAGPEVGH